MGNRTGKTKKEKRNLSQDTLIMTDHDLLTCIDAKLKGLKDQFDNHLKHHFAITLAACGAGVGAILTTIGTLVVFILTK